MVSDRDIKDWRYDLRSAGKSPLTLASYTAAAEAFISSYGGNVTRRAVRDWLKGMTETHSPATVQQRLSIIKLFCKWLRDEGLVEEDACAGIRGPDAAVPVVTPLSKDDIAAMIKAAASERDRALIAWFAATGMRLGEICALRAAAVDLEQQVCIIERGKGGKPRVAPFDANAARHLSLYLRRERRHHPDAALEALWLGKQGALGREGIARALRRAADAAGVKNVHPHRFRHSWAHHMLARGMSEGAVCTIAGWSGRALLDRYAKALAASRALDEYRSLSDT